MSNQEKFLRRKLKASGAMRFAYCALRGLVTGGLLIALAANAGEIATENSPARITINKQPTTVSIWYVDKASSDIAFVKKHFQERLRDMGSTARIVSCDPVVEMRGTYSVQGVESLTPVSYAAWCEVRIDKKGLSIAMCDFPMTGNFSTTSTGSRTLDWFANFISANCPAGG